ncbi:hypothetical protein [Flavobacterium sp. ABG]|uniref:hypothetical protein n=1 Tax=Flavobacterium sp. ABG TaxID=1423322 RepID=UPI000A79CEB8|nr:hypothetical protein [Flavobacterium sp. ABG]
MKKVILIVFFFTSIFSNAQEKETITVPKGIVYNYCSPKVLENAKKLITSNLSNSNDYKLLQENMIVGPELWKRYKDNKNIQKLQTGKVQFHVNNSVLDGQMTHDINDTKIIWDEFKNEVSQGYKIRKANEDELKYYWSVISFDIDEPLLIIETKEHNYILNILKKKLKLLWLDEAPKKDQKPITQGMKETKIEKVLLLSSDDEITQNSSVEDITLIIEKTQKIFNELFQNSEKSGKIMIQFELKKDTNEIQFAVKDDLDLDIMKEFEKRINSEQYPNSKKDPVKLQLLCKVNSFDETE